MTMYNKTNDINNTCQSLSNLYFSASIPVVVRVDSTPHIYEPKVVCIAGGDGSNATFVNCGPESK